MKPLFLNWVHSNSHTPHEQQETLPQENLQNKQISVNSNSMERPLGTKEHIASSSMRPRASCGHHQGQLLGGSLASSRLGNAVDIINPSSFIPPEPWALSAMEGEASETVALGFLSTFSLQDQGQYTKVSSISIHWQQTTRTQIFKTKIHL